MRNETIETIKELERRNIIVRRSKVHARRRPAKAHTKGGWKLERRHVGRPASVAHR